MENIHNFLFVGGDGIRPEVAESGRWRRWDSEVVEFGRWRSWDGGGVGTVAELGRWRRWEPEMAELGRWRS